MSMINGENYVIVARKDLILTLPNDTFLPHCGTYCLFVLIFSKANIPQLLKNIIQFYL